MLVKDVMSTSVITVPPETSVQDLARLLSDHAISGAPVVDSTGRIVGIVSESDLLHRHEIGTERTERHRSGWLDAIALGQAQDYARLHGRKVEDIMTREVVTVSDEAELADVAVLFETRGIKRVPVMQHGKLVGIVSRANLVRALAAAHPVDDATRSSDQTIRTRLLAELDGQNWAQVSPSDILVSHGIVSLWFSASEPEEKRRAIRVAAESIPGVRKVEAHVLPDHN